MASEQMPPLWQVSLDSGWVASKRSYLNPKDTRKRVADLDSGDLNSGPIALSDPFQASPFMIPHLALPALDSMSVPILGPTVASKF